MVLTAAHSQGTVSGPVGLQRPGPQQPLLLPVDSRGAQVALGLQGQGSDPHKGLPLASFRALPGRGR